MADPFLIEGPASISFSGGRTSGYMLRRILDAGIQPNVHVLFADTGKERAETYDFVRACAATWGVEIHTVRHPAPEGVTPFDDVIRKKKFLPNVVARFCTTELKILPMKRWMEARGYEHWSNVVGLRADEPRRVAKARGRDTSKDSWDTALPLAEAGITVRDVTAFWRAAPFDLQLRPWESNCDLCFLKGAPLRERIMADHPELAGWWIEHERRSGARFCKDAPTYAALSETARTQGRIFDNDGAALNEGVDCACTD